VRLNTLFVRLTSIPRKKWRSPESLSAKLARRSCRSAGITWDDELVQ
jgi:hypothetical protein